MERVHFQKTKKTPGSLFVITKFDLNFTSVFAIKLEVEKFNIKFFFQTQERNLQYVQRMYNLQEELNKNSLCSAHNSDS